MKINAKPHVLIEAMLYLAMARLAVRLLPFRLIARWVSALPSRDRSLESPDKIVEAVERASRLAPWRTVCIHQGIAAHRMLSRRGYGSQFVYGAGLNDRSLNAHVWVCLGADIVIGGEAVDGCAEVARFPSSNSIANAAGFCPTES